MADIRGISSQQLKFYLLWGVVCLMPLVDAASNHITCKNPPSVEKNAPRKPTHILIYYCNAMDIISNI